MKAKKLSALLVTLCAAAMLLAAPVTAAIDPVLIFSAETNLTVSVDGSVSDALSDTVPYGEAVTLTAPTVPNKTFRYWTNGEGEVISYSRDLTLTMYANTSVSAVYGASVTAKTSAAFLNVTRTDGEIVFNAIASATGNITGAGIRYSTTKNTLNDLKGTEGVMVVAADGTPNWTLIVTPTDENTTCCAVAYVTIGTETTYSMVKAVKLSELNYGVSMVTNLGDILLPENMNISFATVTFDANGGAGAMAPQGVVKGAATALNANTFTREGYTFNGWSTTPTGSVAYSDGQSVTLSEDTTLYAQWSSKYSDSSGRSGGSSSGTATTVTVPVTGDSGTVSVSVSVKDKDATVAPLTEKQVDSIVGTGSTASTVEIDASSLGKEITTVTIPADTVKVIEAAVSSPDKDAESLTVKLSEGSITFDAEALKTIAEQTKGDGLKVNLDDIGTEKLNSAQKTAVSDLTVETVLDAYVTSGSTRISDFKGGSATVSVKHTLKADQRPAGIVVWYVADNGTRTQIPATFRNGEVVFTVTHFSNYVIAYDAERAANSHLNCQKDATCPITAFTDASATAWYHDGVHFALENNIMSGYGNGKFGPGDTTSRAMMAQILWNMEGKPAVNYAMSYTDVDTDAWYAEAVRWANAEGIVEGYSNTKFGPNDAVTREQLAVILYRYAQYKKADMSASASLSNYGDAQTVSGWATSAMQGAVGSGIINGIDGNLAPVNHATRAQVATMLMRYSTAK